MYEYWLTQSTRPERELCSSREQHALVDFRDEYRKYSRCKLLSATAEKNNFFKHFSFFELLFYLFINVTKNARAPRIVTPPFEFKIWIVLPWGGSHWPPGVGSAYPNVSMSTARMVSGIILKSIC